MRFSVVWSCATLLLGCVTVPQGPADGPSPISLGTAADFSPVVPAAPGPADCEVRESDGDDPSARALTLVQGRPHARRVTVTVDGRGTPFRYMDVRSSATASDAARADRTTIGLYLREGYAVAGNQPAGKPLEVVEIPLEEAWESERLGRPAEMLERVLTRCGVTR